MKTSSSFLYRRGFRVVNRLSSARFLTSQSLSWQWHTTASPYHNNNNNSNSSNSNHLQTKRSHSTESLQQPQPLFLWLGTGDNNDDQGRAAKNKCWTRLLLPKTLTTPPFPLVHLAETALQLVNQHYEATDSFVGGMGESDPGVWFASVAVVDDDDDNNDARFHDPLQYADLVAECIELVQTERHGVPFGLYTTGILSSSSSPPSVPLTDLGLDCLHVSLFAGNPKDYVEAIQHHCGSGSSVSEKDFGTVCGFIADAAEQGLPVEVGLAQAYATGAARDLALSLGAQNVHVY